VAHLSGAVPCAIAKRRWLALLVPLALAALLSGLLIYVLHAAPLGERVRLDGSSMRSHRPDIAASADGEYVAAVWSDGYISTAAGQGYIYLAYGIEARGGWPRVRVYPATASQTNLATQPAIAFYPGTSASTTTVHMVWSFNEGTSTSFNRIVYASCNLANPATCRSSAIPTATVRSVASGNVLMPDIAVDKNEGRHVVWLEASGTNTSVWYASSSNGSSWTSPDDISPTSGYTATRPAIAYANVGSKGCLHIVWAGGTSTFNHIGYKRIDLGPNDCGGDLGPLYFNQAGGLFSHSDPQNPSVAAAEATVYVAWDVDSGHDDPPFQYYYLVYNYSNNSGSSWARSDGGPDPEYLDFPSGSFSAFTNHPALDETQTGRTQYGSRLRPDVTLEITTTLIPHLVWNEVVTESEEVYHFDVFHTIRQTGWVTPATNVTDGNKQNGSTDIDSAAPAIVVGKEGHKHVAYMETQQPGSDVWDFVLYQGPIANTGSGVYLPIILKNSS